MPPTPTATRLRSSAPRPTSTSTPTPTSTSTSTLPPIGASQVTASLGVTPLQLRKLRECGLLGSPTDLEALRTPGGQWRYPFEAVRELHARPLVELPSAGYDLAVHLAPLRIDEHARTHVGWSASAGDDGLSAAQIEDAWVGSWPVRHPERHVGSALVGDVAGFIVEVAHICDYRHVDGAVRFEVSSPAPAVLRRYAGRRFHAAPGDRKQRLLRHPSTRS